MVRVQDVARYILNELAPEDGNKFITAWKLQKLVYYSQVWSLVWDEAPLFKEPIQAWADGPVCSPLYAMHKGRLRLRANDIGGAPSQLNLTQKKTIDAVLTYYGNKSGRYLSDLTHMERPWIEARGSTPAGDRSENIISHEAMAEYYGGL